MALILTHQGLDTVLCVVIPAGVMLELSRINYFDMRFFNLDHLEA